VEVVEVAPRPLTLNVVTQGTVQPRTQTVLTPEVSGRIVAVSPHFVAGGFFREGEVLLEIDPSDYEAAVARAEAEVARQSVLLTQEQARSDQARRDWEAMGRGDPNELTLRVPQMNEARANLRSAEAALATARRNLERTRVRAPYDGLVREKRADVGQYVGSNAELGSIFATDYAEIRLPLADEDLAYLELPVVFGAQEAQAGPPVVLEGRYAGRPHTWPARIVRTEGTVDPASRLVYAVARVEDPYNRQTPGHGVPLPVGLFVRASIQGISLPDAIVLPRQTLRERNQLFVVTPGNTINVREVDVLRADSRDIVLTGGVAAGERVALSALEFVTEGMQVEPLLQENPVPAAVASTAKPSEVAGE
jgi:RND family efflux transporter MFP subunit